MNATFASLVVLACAGGAAAGQATFSSVLREVYTDVPYMAPPPGETYTFLSMNQTLGDFQRQHSSSFAGVGSSIARQMSQIGDAHIQAEAQLSLRRTGLSEVWGSTSMSVQFEIDEARPMWISWLLTTPTYGAGELQPTAARGSVRFEGPGFAYDSAAVGNDFEWSGVGAPGVYRLSFSLSEARPLTGVQFRERSLEVYLSIPAPGSAAAMMGVVMVGLRRRRGGIEGISDR